MSSRASEYERAALARLARCVGVADAKIDPKATQQRAPMPAMPTRLLRPSPYCPSPRSLRAIALDLLRRRLDLVSEDLGAYLDPILQGVRAARLDDLARALPTITSQQDPHDWSVALVEAALEAAERL